MTIVAGDLDEALVGQICLFGPLGNSVADRIYIDRDVGLTSQLMRFNAGSSKLRLQVVKGRLDLRLIGALHSLVRLHAAL